MISTTLLPTLLRLRNGSDVMKAFFAAPTKARIQSPSYTPAVLNHSPLFPAFTQLFWGGAQHLLSPLSPVLSTRTPCNLKDIYGHLKI